jgi:hypothetical protein
LRPPFFLFNSVFIMAKAINTLYLIPMLKHGVKFYSVGFKKRLRDFFAFVGLRKSFAEIFYRLRVLKSVCGNFFP